MNKKLVIGLASATLAFGLGAVAVNQVGYAQPLNVYAADGDYLVNGVINGANHWQSGYSMKDNGDGTYTCSGIVFQKDDQFKIAPSGDGDWQGWWSFSNGGSSAEIKEMFHDGGGSDHNIVCDVGGTFDITYNSSNYLMTLTESVVPMVTVTFDYSHDSLTKEVEVAQGSTVLSETPYWFGHEFTAWKLSDSVFDFDTPITEDITLTATWDAMSDVRYFYVLEGTVGASAWSSRYIYGTNSSSDDASHHGWGDWKGQLFTNISKTRATAVKLGNGTGEWGGNIYKVPYYGEYNMNTLFFHNGNGSQKSFDLIEGNLYVYNGETTGDSTDKGGVAAKVAFDFDAAILSNVEDDGTCGVSKERAEALYNEYATAILDSDVKDWLDDSHITLNTKKYENNSIRSVQDVSIADIAEEFRKKAGLPISGGLLYKAESASDETPIMVAIAIIASLGFAGAFLVLRRRNQE